MKRKENTFHIPLKTFSLTPESRQLKFDEIMFVEFSFLQFLPFLFSEFFVCLHRFFSAQFDLILRTFCEGYCYRISSINDMYLIVGWWETNLRIWK